MPCPSGAKRARCGVAGRGRRGKEEEGEEEGCRGWGLVWLTGGPCEGGCGWTGGRGCGLAGGRGAGGALAATAAPGFFLSLRRVYY